MAITKAVSGNIVRGYYVTTLSTGRATVLSGKGFGLPRLGGLPNSQVDGLAGGGSAASLMAEAALTPRQALLHSELTKEAERISLAEHQSHAHKAEKPADPAK